MGIPAFVAAAIANSSFVKSCCLCCAVSPWRAVSASRSLASRSSCAASAIWMRLLIVVWTLVSPRLAVCRVHPPRFCWPVSWSFDQRRGQLRALVCCLLVRPASAYRNDRPTLEPASQLLSSPARPTSGSICAGPRHEKARHFATYTRPPRKRSGAWNVAPPEGGTFMLTLEVPPTFPLKWPLLRGTVRSERKGVPSCHVSLQVAAGS
jgi:hypothetical protein